MELKYLYIPSQKQRETYGTEAEQRMQDNFAYVLTGEPQHPMLTIAGIDFANTYKGPKTMKDPSSARIRGLDEGSDLTMGEIGSTVATEIIASSPRLSGKELILSINEGLRTKCRELGIIPPGMPADEELPFLEKKRAELPTGYAANVVIDASRATITAVGDIYVYIDGIRCAGQEKIIDVLKKHKVDRMARKLNIPRQEAHERFNGPLTEMQFEKLQNNKKSGGSLYYPAFDGTVTEDFEFVTVPVKKGTSVLLHTDGLKPIEGKTPRTIADLEAVNTIYGEQTAIEVLLDDDWTDLNVTRVQ